MRHARHVVPIISAAVTAVVVAALGLAPPAWAAAVHYVALGDSYSSGVGAGDYISGSGDCDRSPNAYSALWAAAHSPTSYTSVACSGATTADVKSGQLSALSPTTTLISITIGGNDENFSSIMEDCNLDSDSTCVKEINAAEADAKTNLPGKLTSLFAAIRAKSPSARLVVLDYPHFYDLANSCIGLSQTDRTKIDEGIDVLASVLKSAAIAAGAVFADVRGAFAGHEICDSNRWLHSINVTDVDESYHPTADGHAQAYLPVFTAAA